MRPYDFGRQLGRWQAQLMRESADRRVDPAEWTAAIISDGMERIDRLMGDLPPDEAAAVAAGLHD